MPISSSARDDFRSVSDVSSQTSAHDVPQQSGGQVLPSGRISPSRSRSSESSTPYLPGTDVEVSGSCLRPAQNQSDRAATRRSDRIEKRNDSSVYRTSTGRAEAINSDPNCPRGGTKRKKKKKKNAGCLDHKEGRWEVTNLLSAATGDAASRASELLSFLSQGSSSNLDDSSSLAWINSMKTLVVGRTWEDENSALVTNSITSLVLRCKRSLQMSVGLEFITMINMLQLAAKCDRQVN